MSFPNQFFIPSWVFAVQGKCTAHYWALTIHPLLANAHPAGMKHLLCAGVCWALGYPDEERGFLQSSLSGPWERSRSR